MLFKRRNNKASSNNNNNNNNNKNQQMTAIFKICLLLFCIFALSKGKKTEKKGVRAAQPNFKEVKYLQCSICEQIVAEVISKIETLQLSSEASFAHYLENVCNRDDDDQSSWLRKIDIIEMNNSNNKDEKTLSVDFHINHNDFQKCGVECKTAGATCKRLIDEVIDQERIVTYLSQNRKTLSAKVSDAKAQVCNQFEKLCPTKFILPPTFKRIDYPYVQMPSDETWGEFEARRKALEHAATTGGCMGNFELSDAMIGIKAHVYASHEPLILKGIVEVGKPFRANTYLGHQWIIKINDKPVKTFTVGLDKIQYFILSWENMDKVREL